MSKKLLLVFVGLVNINIIFFALLIKTPDVMSSAVVFIIAGIVSITGYYFNQNVKQKKIISENFIETLHKETLNANTKTFDE